MKGTRRTTRRSADIGGGILACLGHQEPVPTRRGRGRKSILPSDHLAPVWRSASPVETPPQVVKKLARAPPSTHDSEEENDENEEVSLRSEVGSDAHSQDLEDGEASDDLGAESVGVSSGQEEEDEETETEGEEEEEDPLTPEAKDDDEEESDYDPEKDDETISDGEEHELDEDVVQVLDEFDSDEGHSDPEDEEIIVARTARTNHKKPPAKTILPNASKNPTKQAEKGTGPAQHKLQPRRTKVRVIIDDDDDDDDNNVEAVEDGSEEESEIAVAEIVLESDDEMGIVASDKEPNERGESQSFPQTRDGDYMGEVESSPTVSVVSNKGVVFHEDDHARIIPRNPDVVPQDEIEYSPTDGDVSHKRIILHEGGDSRSIQRTQDDDRMDEIVPTPREEEENQVVKETGENVAFPSVSSILQAKQESGSEVKAHLSRSTPLRRDGISGSEVKAPLSRSVPLRREGSVQPGKWKLGSKIGSGAFGVVHVGMNTLTGKLMAVKTITMDRASVADIRREVELLRSLDHPNIVRYYGAEINKTDLHIFQEWVPGGSVAALLSKFGPFSIQVLRSYLRQSLLGLEYLHQCNILHRDIKGSNILVDDEGTVKLADFGASKKIAELQGNMMLSLTMRGTPYFMAPEVFEEKYSSSADIWSIGCVAIQMASGSPPWKSLGYTNPVALFNHIKGTSGPPAFEMAEDALSKEMSVSHKQFQKLLRRCFDRNPESRPSAEAILRDSFFMHETPRAEDDDRSNARGLFSPASSYSVSITPQRSATTPMKQPVERRNSIGPSLSSPLFSPPLSTRANGRDCTQSLHATPPADTTDWPSWAKNKGQQGENGHPYESLKPVDQITGSFDSLALSESPKSKSSLLAVSSTESNYDSRSPLKGLRLVSFNNRTVENKGT